jgi:integrase
MSFKYSEPKVCHYKYDLTKKWFVYFRATNPESGQKKLFVFKSGINTFNNKAERIQEANELKKVLEYKLKHENWNPFTRKVETPIEKRTLLQHLSEMLELKAPVMKPKSIRTYREIVAMFRKWMEVNSYSKLYPVNFTPLIAREYLDYLLRDRNYSGKTHNSQMGILKTLFNQLVEREIIQKNPFAGIKALPEEIGKNVAFTREEREKIRDHLKEHNKRLYFAVQFLYYCFIRRSELIQLRVGDIDFQRMTITISSSASKNRKQESVTIPKSFEPILYEMGLDLAPKDFFIFGFKFQTCAKRMRKADNLTTAHKKILNEIGIRKECSFYGWKHTGVASLYQATKDPYLVMSQCRHSDIKITMIYLRSMGLQVNERIRTVDFEL